MWYLIIRDKEEDNKKESEENKMKREEREERIQKLESQIFMIYMIDRWTNENRKRLAALEEELKELKKEA